MQRPSSPLTANKSPDRTFSMSKFPKSPVSPLSPGSVTFDDIGAGPKALTSGSSSFRSLNRGGGASWRVKSFNSDGPCPDSISPPTPPSSIAISEVSVCLVPLALVKIGCQPIFMEVKSKGFNAATPNLFPSKESGNMLTANWNTNWTLPVPKAPEPGNGRVSPPRATRKPATTFELILKADRTDEKPKVLSTVVVPFGTVVFTDPFPIDFELPGLGTLSATMKVCFDLPTASSTDTGSSSVISPATVTASGVTSCAASTLGPSISEESSMGPSTSVTRKSNQSVENTGLWSCFGHPFRQFWAKLRPKSSKRSRGDLNDSSSPRASGFEEQADGRPTSDSTLAFSAMTNGGQASPKALPATRLSPRKARTVAPITPLTKPNPLSAT